MKKLITITAAAFLLSSCQLIYRGTTQKFNIDSKPQGAKVTANGTYLGTTPLSVELSRCNNYNLVFEKSGYRDDYFAALRKWDNHFGVMAFGPIGAIIDDVSCASFTYYNTNIIFDLSKN